MVYVVLYQTVHQFFVGYTCTQAGLALLIHQFLPFFFGEILNNARQIYVHQLQIINIIVPFLFVGRTGIGPVAAKRLARFLAVQPVQHLLRPA